MSIEKQIRNKRMLIQENGPARDKCAEPLNITLIETSNTKNLRQKIEVPQAPNYEAPGQFGHEPLPSLFELVAQNVEAPMRRAAVYLRVCDEFRRLGDIESFCESCDK